MLNVFTMRTQETGLHAASGMESYGLVFHSDGIVFAGSSKLQNEKSNVLASTPQS